MLRRARSFTLLPFAASVAALGMLGGAVGDHAPHAPLVGGDVLVINFAFGPAVVVAHPGDVVTWRVLQNDPDFAHTVTSDDDGGLLPSAGDGTLFDLSTAGADTVAWRVPPEAPRGLVGYYCIPHWGIGMRGWVLVG